ncbi:hypothetical protein [Nocardia testacea]|uniref:hypothetical protein n=1 Tax=Nocardia testacea TaxID=248551 RepID=UPI0033C3692E
MDGIAIVGCGGSGKTHLARQVAPLLDLPVTHLDAIYYDQDWNPPGLGRVRRPAARAGGRAPVADRRELRRHSADAAGHRRYGVFLDLPALTCLLGIAQRRWRYRGGQHKGGVYDRITWEFVKFH